MIFKGKSLNSIDFLLLTSFLVFIFNISSFAQPFHLHTNQEQFYSFEEKINEPGSNYHTSIKPYAADQLNGFIQPDSIKINENIFKRKLLDDNFFHAEKSDFNITADPLFAIVPSINIKDKNMSAETNWGIFLKSKFNNQFIFSASLLYNASSFNNYLQSKIDTLNVIPGQGYAHKYGGNYEYLNQTFYFAYQPIKYFTFEAGLGKNFWGDGYRSMLLSDNAYNYPYFKIETNIWKIKYVNLWANFKDIRNTSSSAWESFHDKYGSMHYLSWNVTKRFNLGLFEAIIWDYGQGASVRGFEMQYANPIIFFRPVEFSLGSPDNALMGLNFKYSIFKKTVIYAQVLIDDMVTSEIKNDVKHLLRPADSTINYGSWMNKQAMQLGIKIFDIFTIKNLYFQTEWNAARPYTYSHRQVYLNYGHYNQPLAHPLGANFSENIFILRYNINRWALETKFMYALTGLDSMNSHFGSDIYKSTFDSYQPLEHNIIVNEYKNHVGQGIATHIYYAEFKISYLINKKNNLRADAGFIGRTQQSSLSTSKENFFYLGIRTTIPERYYDF